MIPSIPIQQVLEERADGPLAAAAGQYGFLTLSGVDDALTLGETRSELFEIFQEPEATRRRMLRRKYDPNRANVYRGYFPAEPEKNAMVEGFDLGPDIVDPARAGGGDDPLTEPTPRPDLPRWEAAAGRYYAAMSRIGAAVTRSLLRGIGGDPAIADRLFDRSISTLRLLRYPPTPPERFGPDRRLPTEDGGADRFVMTKRHTDSGFVTVLWQDGSGGLEVEAAAGDWLPAPPAKDGLVVNFGQMLSDWSGGRIRAAPHRVIAGGHERFSIPFFFEPAVDARIAPLFPQPADEADDGYIYGDFLWDRMREFPNFHGVGRRRPDGAAARSEGAA